MQNFAALRAAVFLLFFFSKTSGGGGGYPPSPVGARVKLIISIRYRPEKLKTAEIAKIRQMIVKRQKCSMVASIHMKHFRHRALEQTSQVITLRKVYNEHMVQIMLLIRCFKLGKCNPNRLERHGYHCILQCVACACHVDNTDAD